MASDKTKQLREVETPGAMLYMLPKEPAQEGNRASRRSHAYRHATLKVLQASEEST